MGFRIEVEEGEPIADTLRRFRSLSHREGGQPRYHFKWHKRRYDYYLKPSVLNRRRRWIARVKKRYGARYGPDPDYWWADDLETRPRKSWGRLRLFILT